MFEVNGIYANRKGTYTVLEIDPPKMQVRYHDGSYAELNMNIQERIWQNILVEREAAEARASRSARVMQRSGNNTRYFVKSVSLPIVEELMFPGWQARVVMVANPLQARRVNVGDRIVYYAIEADAFVAVATITGEAFRADPKDYFYAIVGQEKDFFPVDVDVVAFSPDQGVLRNSVELENYPKFSEMLAQPESLISISEDDFELIAELLTELSEEDNNGIDEEDYEEEDEE